MYSRIFNSIPGPCPLDASNTLSLPLPPSHGNQKYLQKLPNASWGAKLAPTRSTDLSVKNYDNTNLRHLIQSHGREMDQFRETLPKKVASKMTPETYIFFYSVI